VRSIGAYAFAYTDITSISIPSSVISIGEYAFNGSSITAITIPSSVTSIGQYAFGLTQITSIVFTLYATVKLLGLNIGSGQTYYGLRNINISALDAILFSGSGVLTQNIVSSQLTKQTNVLISGYTSIDANAFANAYITSISIPSYVTSIGEYAFNGTNLTSISIPSSVTSIGQNAFSNSSIATINVALGNSYYSSDNSGVLFDVSGTTLIQYPSGKTQSSYIISSTVTTIGQYAFQYSSYLSQIVIPPSVQTIGNNAFYLCVPLETIQIDLSSNLSSIGDNAFAGTHITSINIPASVQTIGNNAFNGIQNLKVYSQYINNLNLTEQTNTNFYGATNTDVILYGEPAPQPPAPAPTQQPAQYQSNGYGPIQICTSRLANCKITKTNFQNGYVMNNRATAMQRMSTLISVQSQMRNATWTQIYAPTNAYSQRTGGPVGYGQSPRNTF
jgi:hypothetical protein